MRLSRTSRARLAWFLSFFKRSWTLKDYPIDYVDQGSSSPFPGERHPHYRWRADLLGLHHLSGLGETKEIALRDAQNKFAMYVASGAELRRPGSKPKVIFASDVQVTRFPELKDHFIGHVLELEWAFLSDESSLWDFHGELDNSTFYHRIGIVYGVDVSHVPGANISAILDEIMRQIVQFPGAPAIRAIREDEMLEPSHSVPSSWIVAVKLSCKRITMSLR